MKLEELTALYSPLDIEYSQAMSGPYEDLSFRSDEVTVIAGLKDGRISGFWRPVVAVGDERLQKLQIERLYDICRNIYYMDFLIDGRLSVISQFLLRHGHKARPYYTQIIDTSKEHHILHSEIRKSYKSLVNKCGNVGYGDITDYKVLHSLTTKPRYSSKSFVIQQRMLEAEEAVCMLDGNNAAVIIYKNQYSAYYAGGKSVPGFNTHALVWQAIIRNKGKIFELGAQLFSGDEKLVNISKFKRGMGGTTQVRLILEREQ